MKYRCPAKHKSGWHYRVVYREVAGEWRYRIVECHGKLGYGEPFMEFDSKAELRDALLSMLIDTYRCEDCAVDTGPEDKIEWKDTPNTSGAPKPEAGE